MPVDPAESVAEAFENLTEGVQDASYTTDISFQVPTFQFLNDEVTRGGLAILADPRHRAFVDLVANRLGCSRERVVAMAQLRDPIELRRSLKNTALPAAERLPHEEVYPSGEGWLAAYLDVNLLSEQPIAWHFWAAMVALGSACRRNFYMDTDRSNVLFPNQFVFLVGDTGLGKSECIGRMETVYGAANNMARQLALDEYNHPSSERRDFMTPVLSITTTEATIDTMMPKRVNIKGEQDTVYSLERTESLALICNDEASTLFGKSRDKVADSLIPSLTDWWNAPSTPKVTVTRGRGERNLGPCAVSGLWGSTSQWIADSITSSMMSGGFTGRCLFIGRAEHDRIYYRDIPKGSGPDPAAIHQLARMMLPLMCLTTPIEVVPDEHAQAWFEDFYTSHKDSELPHSTLNGYWQRKPQHIQKVAMLLAISDVCSPAVDVPSLRRVRSLLLHQRHYELAKKLLEIEEHHMPSVFAKIGEPASERVARIALSTVEAYYRRNGEPMPLSMLGQRLKQEVGLSSVYTPILETLVETEELQRTLYGRAKSYQPSKKLTARINKSRGKKG